MSVTAPSRKPSNPVIHPPPLGVTVVATENDPVQKIQRIDHDSFRISGTARNNGVVASFFDVELDGKRVHIPLSRGMTPGQTAAALKKALPKGYKLDFKLTHRHLGSDVIVDIRRDIAAPKESLVDSPHSKKATVSNVKLAGRKLSLDFLQRDTARAFVYDVEKKTGAITVRVADYDPPNRPGLMVIRTQHKEITLPAAPKGTRVVVKNHDGSTVFTGKL